LPRSLSAVAAIASLVAAAEARAQSVEINPFVGYDFGGSARDAALDQQRSFDASLAYGGTLSFPISPGWRFELLYSRQDTRLGGGLSPSFDVAIERYLGGFQEEKGEGNVRWIGSAWLGATRFIPGLGGFDSVTKFGAGVGLGVKLFFAKNLGLRLETRALYTLVKGGEGGVLCTNGTCLFAFSGTGLWQGDVNAGLILAF
jgi:opacity protein-like surface antigen